MSQHLRPFGLPRLFLSVVLTLLGVAYTLAASAAVPLHTGQLDLIPGAEATNYQSVAYDAGTNTWYVGSQENSLALVDGATGLVSGQITLPSSGVQSMALDAAAHRLYAVGGGDLMVIDTVAKTATSISLPHGGSSLAIDPGLHRCYVTSSFANELAIVNTLTNAVVTTITTGQSPRGVAVNPTSHILYVACGGDFSTPNSGKVSFIDPTQNPPAEFDSIVQDGTRQIAFNPANSRLYFSTSTNFGSTNSVRIVNPTTGLDTSVQTAFVKGIVLDPSGSGKVYALDGGSAVHVIATDNTATSFPAAGALGLAASSTSVAIVRFHELDFYSPAGALSGAVQLSAQPVAMAVNPQTNKIYVVSSATNSLFVVDATTQKTLKTLTFDTALGGVAANPVTNRVYLLIPSDPTDGVARLVSIDGSDDHVIYDDAKPTVLTDPQNLTYQSFAPTRLAVDSVHNRVYVLQNNDPGYVTVVNGAEERPGFDPVNHTPIDQVGSNPYSISYDGASNLLIVGAYANNVDHTAAAIVIKPPQSGPPTATVFDSGTYDSNAFTDIVYNSATNRIYATGSNPADASHEAKIFTPGPGNVPYSVSKRFPLPGNYYSGQLALNAGLNRVYVLGASSQGHVLRTITNEALDATYDTFTLFGAAIAFDTTHNNIYVAGRPSLTNPQQLGGLVDVYFDGPDTTPPVTSIVTPADGTSISALLLVNGTINVSDARSDVASVQYSLRNAQGQYWDGTQWVANEVYLTATQGSNGDWTFKFPTRAQGLVKGTYTLHVQATDSANNVKNVSSQFTIITPGALSFSQSSYSVAETGGHIDITVQRTNGSDGPITVNYFAHDGTAIRDEGSVPNPQTGGFLSFGDFDYTVGTLNTPQFNDDSLRVLSFADGETSKTFRIDISPDQLIESNEHVTLGLNNVTPGAELGATPTADLTITESNPAARVANLGSVPLLPYGNISAPSSIVVDPASNDLYVGSTKRIGVFDGTTGLQKAAIDSFGLTLDYTYDAPSVAVDPALNRCYVVSSPVFQVIAQAHWTLRTYTLDTFRLLSEMPIPASGTFLRNLRLNPATHLLYLSAYTGTLEIDPATNQIVRTLPDVNHYDFDNTRHRIVNYQDGDPFDHHSTFSFIDLVTGEKTAVQTEIYSGQFAYDGTHGIAYVAGTPDGNTGGYILRAISSTGATADVTLSISPAGIAVDEANNLIFVSGSDQTNGSNVVLKFTGGATPVAAGTLATNTQPLSGPLVFQPSLHRLCSVSGGTGDHGNEVITVDTQTGALSRIVTAAAPSSIATVHTAAGEKIYAADGQEDVIFVIDGATNSVLKQIRTGALPGPIAGLDSLGKVHFFSLSDPDQSTGATTLRLHTIDATTDVLDPNPVSIGSPALYQAFQTFPTRFAFRLLADDSAHTLYTAANVNQAAPVIYRIDADPSHGSTYLHVTHTMNVQSSGIAPSFDSIVYHPLRHRLYGLKNSIVSGHTNVDFEVFDGGDLHRLSSTPVGVDVFYHTYPSGAAVDSARDIVYFPIWTHGQVISAFDVKPGDANENKEVGNFEITYVDNPYNSHPELGLKGAVVNPTTHHAFIADYDRPPHGAAVVLNTLLSGSESITANLSEVGDGVAMAFDATNQCVYAANSLQGTVTVLHDLGAELAPLPQPQNLDYNVSDTVAGIPWLFSVDENSDEAGLTIEFQYSDDGGVSWHTLPGNPTKSSHHWTLTTGGVPAGSISFRALASAPNFASKASQSLGPVTVAQGTPPPSGKVIEFGDTEYAGVEGAVITVTVLRGTDSTGQVVVPFQVGGSAVPFTPGAKTYDYKIDPPALLLTFHEGEFVQQITITVNSTKGSEPTKLIDLRLQNPIGDAIVGDPAVTFISLVDGKPSILHTPPAPNVDPTNVVPVPKGTKPPKGSPINVRNGSAWNFDVTEAFPPAATDGTVEIQMGPSTTGPWTDLVALHPGKGAHWTGFVNEIPEGAATFFRAVASATGYPPTPGPATKQSYKAQPGPNLTVFLSGVSGLDQTGQHLPPRNDHASDVFEGEFMEYRFACTNSGDLDAGPCVLSVAIPKHTTVFAAVGEGATVSQVMDKKGRVALVNFTFTTGIGQHLTNRAFIQVQVDSAAGFSSKDASAGFGQIITLDTFNLTALTQGVTSAAKSTEKLDTRVVGPLDLLVSQQLLLPQGQTRTEAREGDVIEYTLQATNNGSAAIQNNAVTDHFPPGSALEALFTVDNTGNSTTQKLLNPGPFSAPQVLYGFDPAGPSLDLTALAKFITSPTLLKVGAKEFKKLKGSTEYDFVDLRAKLLAALSAAGHSGDITQFDDAVNKTIAAHSLVATGVRWRIAAMSAKQTLTLKFHVHVQFLLDQLAARGQHVPTAIVNGGFLASSDPKATPVPFYDFTSILDATSKPASALYGGTPPALGIPLDLAAAGLHPALALRKEAAGDHTLNKQDVSGNGSLSLPGLGTITNVVTKPGHGFDFVLTYANIGSAPATGVEIHEVIPYGAELLGFFTQSENGGAAHAMNAEQFTYYDADGNDMGAVSSATIRNVRAMKITLTNVAALGSIDPGQYGQIRYTLASTLPATPIRGAAPVIVAVGGHQIGLPVADPYQGAYITADGFAAEGEICTPALLQVHLMNDVNFDNHCNTVSAKAKAGADVVQTVDFTQNGDVTAEQARLVFSLLPGTIFNAASGAVRTKRNGQTVSEAITSTVRGTTVDVPLGDVPGHETGTIQIKIHVNSPLDPALAKIGNVWIKDANIGVIKDLAKRALVPGGRRPVAAQTGPTLRDTVPVPAQPVRIESNQPTLILGRSAPYFIKRDTANDDATSIRYVIYFANAGDSDAHNVELGMQMPYGTSFPKYDNGILAINGAATGNPSPATTAPRSAGQVKVSGAGPDTVRWHIGTLPAHSAGSITLTAHVSFNFFENCVRDHSLYISSSDAQPVVVAPDPIGTWVTKRTFEATKAAVLENVLNNLHITHTGDAQLEQRLSTALAGLTVDAQLDATAAADLLVLDSGERIMPVGNNQVLVVDSTPLGNPVTTGSSVILVADGPTRVAAGAADKIFINGLSAKVSGVLGAQTATCATLLSRAIDLANGHAADILRSKSETLVRESNGSHYLVSNTNGQDTLLIPQNVSLAQAGVSTIGNVDGNVSGVGAPVTAGAKLQSQEGAITALHTLAGLGFASNGGIINEPGHLVATGGGNLAVGAGGQIVAQGAGNGLPKDIVDFMQDGGAALISQDGVGIISKDGAGQPAAGGQIVAQGGLNESAQGANKIIGEHGSGVVSNDGGSIIGEHSSGFTSQKQTGNAAAR